MIRGIHYFSAEVKPKLMSSQGAALNDLKKHFGDMMEILSVSFPFEKLTGS